MHRTCKLNQGDAKQSGASLNPIVLPHHHYYHHYFTGLLPLPQSLSPEVDDILGTQKQKRPATQMTCRTDENTYTYGVPNDSKGRERIFLRRKMKFLNRGITEK